MSIKYNKREEMKKFHEGWEKHQYFQLRTNILHIYYIQLRLLKKI